MTTTNFSTSRDSIIRGRGPTIPDQDLKLHPMVADHAKGAYIWDTDGQRFVDFVLSFGAVVLGHANEIVNRAVYDALLSGVAPTLHSRQHFALAEELTSILPGDDLLCTFFRTGSDATSAAVRICRAATGRDRVVRVGYTGWHDWSAPRTKGVPLAVQELTTVVPFNDFDLLEIAMQGDDVACIVLVPFDTELALPGYFDRVAAIASKKSTLLVCDEMRTGFRLAIGGAQEYFSLKPDLSCYSKAIANGHSISAVVGRSEIMEVTTELSMSSVFFRSIDGIAAARATLKELTLTDVIQQNCALGEQLMLGLSDAARSAGTYARPTGIPAMPFHQFEYGDDATNASASITFSRECMSRGVLFHPFHQWFVCGATTEADIDVALSVAHQAYGIVAKKYQ